MSTRVLKTGTPGQFNRVGPSEGEFGPNNMQINDNTACYVLLWLDDIRPAPEGWLHVRTVAEAQTVLSTGRVLAASLDHDLGACTDCLGGRTPDQWLEDSAYQSMPNCSHVGTGYELCLWMAEKGIWPKEPPNVHSANPVGRERMQGVIARYFPDGEE